MNDAQLLLMRFASSSYVGGLLGGKGLDLIPVPNPYPCMLPKTNGTSDVCLTPRYHGNPAGLVLNR